MSSKRFQDKVVIITGGNSGIGKATAQLFALEGAKVVISGRDSDRLEEARKLVVRNSGSDENVLVVAGDLLLESVQKELIEKTKQKFGRIDILINNAGCSGPDDCQRVGFDLTPEDFDYTMNLNAKVPVTLTSYAMPHLIEAKGAVVNVGSIAGLSTGLPFQYMYAMSKAALGQFTKSSAIEFIKQGVRINSVNPGNITTEFYEKRGLAGLCDFVCNNRDNIPFGSAGSVWHVARAIAFLSDRSASEYIIGHSLVIDGGASILNPMLIQMNMENFMKTLNNTEEERLPKSHI